MSTSYVVNSKALAATNDAGDETALATTSEVI